MKQIYEEPIISKNPLVAREIMKNAMKVMDDGISMGIAFEYKDYCKNTYAGLEKTTIEYLKDNLPIIYNYIIENYIINQETITVFALIMKSYPEGTEDLFFDL